MTLKDLMDRAMLITGLRVDNDALFYYNEVIDYLLSTYPEKITAPMVETITVSGENTFTVPRSWAFVSKVKSKHGRRIYCDIIGDTMVFPCSGEYEITYTKKPKFMKSEEEPLEHNRIFDICIPYYFAWKMCERDQLSANRVEKYKMLFLEYLSTAVKSKSKFGLKRIKVPRFR